MARRRHLQRREPRPRVFVPYLLDVDTGGMSFFKPDGLGHHTLTDDLQEGEWWPSPYGGDDCGSPWDLESLWPELGRDGRHWLMLTDLCGLVSWIWSERGWLTRREYRASLAITLDDWKDVQ